MSTYAVDPAAAPTCRCRSALTTALFRARHWLPAVPITLFALSIHAVILFAPLPRTPTMPRTPTIHRAGRHHQPAAVARVAVTSRHRPRARAVPAPALTVRLRATTLYRQSFVSRAAHRARYPASKHWTGPPPRCGASRRARAPPWQAVLAWHHHLPSPITLLPRLVSAARAVCRISSPGTGSSASLAACRAVCSINLRPQRPKQTSETDSDQTSLRAQAR